MTARCAALLWLGPVPSPAAPPGIDGAAYAAAMFDDVAEVLHGLEGVQSLVVCSANRSESVRPLLWPDVPIVESAAPSVLSAVRWAQERGFGEVVVVAADAPDLPQLVLAKVFQALARSPVAVAAMDDGAAVAVGVALPAPAWLPDLDLADRHLLAQLRAVAGGPAQAALTPGWHRMRTPDDARRLDAGLEGWEATRALLSGLRAPQEA
ncbi:MAG: DUF2064 domain-containing protein [Pseudonocardiales bacterium]